jgi:hypothetical protein
MELKLDEKSYVLAEKKIIRLFRDGVRKREAGVVNIVCIMILSIRITKRLA